jgi:hypothetical protein
VSKSRSTRQMRYGPRIRRRLTCRGRRGDGCSGDLPAGVEVSECVKPVAGTDSCQARHVGAILAGQLRVVHYRAGEFGTDLE